MWECLTVCQLGLAKVTSLEPWHLKVVPEFASSLFSEAPLNHLCLSSPLLVHHLLEAIFFFFRQEASYFHPPPQKKIVTVRTFGENNLSSEWFCPVLDQFKFSLSHGSMWQPRIIQAHWAESVAFGNGGTAAMPMYGSSQKLCWHTSCSHVKILFYMVNCYFSPLTFWNQLFWGKKYSCR